MYEDKDFKKAFGMTKEEAREIVTERLKAVKMNESVLNDYIKGDGFIFDMLCKGDVEKEWANDYDITKENSARNFVLYVSMD